MCPLDTPAYKTVTVTQDQQWTGVASVSPNEKMVTV